MARSTAARVCRKKRNEMTWERYMAALKGELDTGKNTGFRVHDQGMVTYEQNKLGLSAYLR